LQHATDWNLRDVCVVFDLNESTGSHLLACSSAALAIETESKLLDRIIRWIRELLKKCSDAALLTLRGVEVALRLSPLIILTPASVLMAQWTVGSRGNAISDWTWAYFRSAMTALGPVFVKLCQWVATRRDIFPPHICDRLADLHDRGTQHSWKFTRQELIAAFGEDYQLDGLHIEEDAVIGCGSAAQVYRGTLLQKRNPQTGETASVKCPVAIKVLHPDFDRLVKRDLWFMQTIAEMLHSLPIEHLKMLNLPRACSNFGNRLEQQADLRIEAENLKHFRANFYRNDDEEKHSSIHFPKPMDGWISRNVLVEELIDHAEPIADFLCDASAEGKTTRKELAGPLLRAFLKMVFIDNFVHCDLHPGNVLIQTSTITVDNARGDVWWNPFRHTAHADTLKLTAKKRQIVFLDAGIAASLSKEDQRNLHDLFRAVITNNGNEAGRLMVERAKYERCSQVPGCVDQFATGVGELVEEFHDRRKSGLTLGAVRIGSLLARVLDLCRVHGVEIDPAMASVVST
jgi:aarF domain-containing kinase